jgi:hypothetical protein
MEFEFGCHVTSQAIPLVRQSFLTAMSLVQSHFRSRGILDEQSGTGGSFFPVLPFPLPILILPSAPYSVITVSSMQYSPGTANLVSKQTNKLDRALTLCENVNLAYCTGMHQVS